MGIGVTLSSTPLGSIGWFYCSKYGTPVGCDSLRSNTSRFAPYDAKLGHSLIDQNSSNHISTTRTSDVAQILADAKCNTYNCSQFKEQQTNITNPKSEFGGGKR